MRKAVEECQKARVHAIKNKYNFLEPFNFAKKLSSRNYNRFITFTIFKQLPSSIKFSTCSITYDLGERDTE